MIVTELIFQEVFRFHHFSGHTYNMKISYIPKDKITAMSAKLYGVIAGIPVPFPLPIQ